MNTARVAHQVYGKTFGGNAPENYERYFVPAIGSPLASDLIELASLRPGARVLDVACGTGVVTRLAADAVAPSGSVAGLDVNAGMLAVARSVSAGARLPIRWYESTAEAMPLPDAAFDVVLCQLGLMFIADRHAALTEMHRVLRPGGRVLITTPGPTEFFGVMHDVIEKYVDATTAGFVNLVFSLHDPAELGRSLSGAGFEAVDVATRARALRLPDPVSFFWQYVHSTPLAGAVTGIPAQRREAAERELIAGWQRWTDADGMLYQQPIFTSRARKNA